MLRCLSLLAVLLIPATAAAYDVASSSSGAPLHWADGTSVELTLALDPSPSQVTPDAMRAVAVTSAATWDAVVGAGGVDVGIAAGSAVAAPHADDKVNMVRWLVDKDDPDLEVGLLGRTFIEYQVASGEIADTDVVLDATDFTWTAAGSACRDEYDVQSALTHEFGHALGMAHSLGHPEATMFATADACETTKRDLSADDVAGVQTLYAHSVVPVKEPAQSGGCAAGGDAGGAGGSLLVGAALLARRRRRVQAARIGAIGAVALAVATPAAAAQLRVLDREELADHAALVVRGHVVATSVVRDPGLETDSVVVIDECLAGACPRAVTVRRHGGELGGDGLRVDGEAVLAAGDEVVLYLRVDRQQHARVLGGVQGAWPVTRAADGAPIVVRDLRDQEIAAGGTWRPGDREELTLAALRAELRGR